MFSFLSPDVWPSFVIVTARIVGVMFTAPVWSMPAFPRRIRVTLGVVLGMAMTGFVDPIDPALSGALIIPIVVELFLGLLIGLAVSGFLYGVQVAAEVTSVQMGLAMAASIAPNIGVGGPGIRTIHTLFVLAIYLAFGGHLILVAGIAESFRLVPPGSGLDLLGLHLTFLDLVTAVFVTAVKVGAPLIAAMMLANVLLGILSKAVPQINTLMVAFPITITLGFITILGSLPFVLLLTHGWLDDLGRTIVRVLDAAGGV